VHKLNNHRKKNFKKEIKDDSINSDKYENMNRMPKHANNIVEILEKEDFIIISKSTKKNI